MTKKTQISPLSAMALGATAMVGSGWLFSAQLNAQLAGNYAFLAWVTAASVAVIVAICLASVVKKYPVRGATSMCSTLSHNQIFGMPFAFANWFVVMISIANEAQATTQYLAAASKESVLMVNDSLTIYGKLCAFFILIIYLMINFYGIKLLSRVNDVVTVFKTFIPLFTIVVFLIASFDTTNFTLATNSVYSSSSVITAIIGAGLIYSFNGFQLPASFASEIKNPGKNILISMIGGIVIILAVYMLLQLAFMAAIPHHMIEATGWAGLNFHSPLMNLALLLGLHFIVLLLVADSIVSPSGTGYAYLGASSRMFYAMALSGQMPKWCIGDLHAEYNVCRRSMLINFGLTTLVLFNSDSWASLMVIITGFILIGYMAAPVSMGAINPRTRIFGAFVFVVLSLIMLTIPKEDFMKVNITIMILMASYIIMLFRSNRLPFSRLILFTLPFIIYLWLLYFTSNHYIATVISLVFYALITHTKYVTLCKEYSSANDMDLSKGEAFIVH